MNVIWYGYYVVQCAQADCKSGGSASWLALVVLPSRMGTPNPVPWWLMELCSCCPPIVLDAADIVLYCIVRWETLCLTLSLPCALRCCAATGRAPSHRWVCPSSQALEDIGLRGTDVLLGSTKEYCTVLRITRGELPGIRNPKWRRERRGEKGGKGNSVDPGCTVLRCYERPCLFCLSPCRLSVLLHWLEDAV